MGYDLCILISGLHVVFLYWYISRVYFGYHCVVCMLLYVPDFLKPPKLSFVDVAALVRAQGQLSE